MSFGAEVPDAAAHESSNTVRGLKVAVDVNGLKEIKHAIGALLKSVDDVVGVLSPKAGKDDPALISFPITISIFQEDDLGGVRDIGSTIRWEDRGRNVQVVGKDSSLVGNTITVRVLQNEDLVVFFSAWNDVRIHPTGDEPETASRIEVHLHRLRNHGI